MVNVNQFWSDKKCLITGHTGFKGGWCSLWLSQMGTNVTGYALPPHTSPSFYESCSLGNHLTSHFGDINTPAPLLDAFEKAQPEIVFHFAAQALVRQSYSSPVETFQTNIMGTIQVLEAIRQTPSVRLVIVVTSDKCYENDESSKAFIEDDPMGGYDPYSSSKGCCELICRTYLRSFLAPKGIRLATVRAGNVIGGGDWSEDRLIPDLIRAFSKSETLHIRSPGAIRPWQHVLDPIKGYLMLAETLWEKELSENVGWNFGPADKDIKTVENVIKRAVQLWETPVQWTKDENQHPHEANTLKLNCQKARTLLQWEPVLELDQALSWTIDWYKTQFRDRNAVKTLTLRQINRYEELCQQNHCRRAS